MRRKRWGAAASVAVLAASAVVVAPSASASAATSFGPPYTVTFDSTMVNHFAGIGNEPGGAETTEVQATIPLTGTSSPYSGSAIAKYAQASGTITETCTANSTTGTTEEIEQSGTPTTFQASYLAGSSGSGGNLQLNIGPFTRGLEETFEDIAGCGGGTAGNTTPRFVADFVADHESQLSPLVAPGDAVFDLPLTNPLGAFTGDSTYTFTDSTTDNNLTYSEITRISVEGTVVTPSCVVPNVVGQSQAVALAAITAAGCTVSTITPKAGSGTPGTVLSSSPAAGTQLPEDAPVSLTIVTAVVAKCKVPTVRGDTLASAESKIRKAGCAVGRITKKKSTRRKRGHVLSQSPAGGTSKPSGSKVALTIGR